MEIRSKEILQPAMPSTKSAKDALPAPTKDDQKKDFFGEKLESALSAEPSKSNELKKEKTLTKDKKTSKKLSADAAPFTENTSATKNSLPNKTERSQNKSDSVKTDSPKADSAKTDSNKTRHVSSTPQTPAAGENQKTQVQAQTKSKTQNQDAQNLSASTAATGGTTATPAQAPAFDLQSLGQTAITTTPTEATQAQSIVSPYDVGEKIANLTNLFPEATMSVETTTTQSAIPVATSMASAEKMSTQSTSTEAELAALLGLNTQDLNKAKNAPIMQEPQAFALNRKAETFAQNTAITDQNTAAVQNGKIPNAETFSKGTPITNHSIDGLLAGSKADNTANVTTAAIQNIATPKATLPVSQGQTQPSALGQIPSQTQQPTQQTAQTQLEKTVGTQPQAQPQAQPQLQTQTQAQTQALPHVPGQALPNPGAQFAPKAEKPALNTNAQKPEVSTNAKTLSLKDESIVATTATASGAAAVRAEDDKASQENSRGEKSELPTPDKSMMADNAPVRQQRDTLESKDAAPIHTETTESMSKGALHRAVQTAARLQAQGGGTARIQLNDSKLGNIDLRVTVASGSNVHVEIKSKDQKLRDTLESRMDELRSSLGQHKLNLSECRVISETAQTRNETENRSGNRPDTQTQQQQQNTWSSANQQGSQQRGGDSALPSQLASEPKATPKQANTANIAPKTNIQRGANGSLKVTA